MSEQDSIDMTEDDFILDEPTVKKILDVVDQGLSDGLGKPEPGLMCVEAAVCYAMGWGHTDTPKCVDRVIREPMIEINDGPWESNTERAKALRKLSILQLGTADWIDREKFVDAMIVKSWKETIPFMASLIDWDHVCQRKGRLTTATNEFLSKIVLIEDAKEAYEAIKSFLCHELFECCDEFYSSTFLDGLESIKGSISHWNMMKSKRKEYDPSAISEDLVTIPPEFNIQIKSREFFIKQIEDILISMDVPGVQYLHLLD